MTAPSTAVPCPHPSPPQAAPSTGMALLAAHVPLTLLLDLAWGVSSSEVYETEAPDLSWLPPVVLAS